MTPPIPFSDPVFRQTPPLMPSFKRTQALLNRIRYTHLPLALPASQNMPMRTQRRTQKTALSIPQPSFSPTPSVSSQNLQQRTAKNIPSPASAFPSRLNHPRKHSTSISPPLKTLPTYATHTPRRPSMPNTIKNTPRLRPYTQKIPRKTIPELQIAPKNRPMQKYTPMPYAPKLSLIPPTYTARPSPYKSQISAANPPKYTKNQFDETPSTPFYQENSQEILLRAMHELSTENPTHYL